MYKFAKEFLGDKILQTMGIPKRVEDLVAAQKSPTVSELSNPSANIDKIIALQDELDERVLVGDTLVQAYPILGVLDPVDALSILLPDARPEIISEVAERLPGGKTVEEIYGPEELEVSKNRTKIIINAIARLDGVDGGGKAEYMKSAEPIRANMIIARENF